MSATVVVRNIASSESVGLGVPTEQVVRDFFTFCGPIQSLQLFSPLPPPAPLTALILFDSPNAARTALLLNNALINERPVTVETATEADLALAAPGPAPAPTSAPSLAAPQDASQPPVVGQNESVVVSLLAKGYALGEGALARARALDEEQGVSRRIGATLNEVGESVRTFDQQHAISATLSGWGRSVQTGAEQLGATLQVQERTQAAGAVLTDLGKSVEGVAKSAAQEAEHLVQTTPALHAAQQTLSAWGNSITSVFTQAAAQAQAQAAPPAAPPTLPQ